MIAYYNSYYVTLDGVRLVNKAPIIYLLTISDLYATTPKLITLFAR